VSDEPAAVPAVPSGRASQLAAALSVLELGDCERELLVRATATGSAATIPSQGAEWDAKELAEAADALAHDGFLRRGPDGGLAAADDLVNPTVERAGREARVRAARLAESATRTHAAVLDRVLTLPRAIVDPQTIESTFRSLCQQHRLVINAFPPFVPSEQHLESVNASALAISQQHAGSKIETDVVSADRLRVPSERRFFSTQSRFAGSSVTVADEVPVRLTLFDDSCAMIPMDPCSHELGAWLIEEPAAVAHVGLVLARQLAEAKPWRQPIAVELSRREADVIRLLAAGLTDEGIARRLHITDRTVRRIVAELMAKLGVDSRFALAVECARHALV
jgi:DNA-binding CsgD family transcriptional regulator